ncbi:HMG box-containing protein 4 [Palaemon carinicauda]|uniref:HMG box-containing protein 4 n=1 Tax=Palaemon carinicauda TaxID=392227 RepID=UPI0035B5C5E8
MESPKIKPGDSPEGGGVADVTGISRSGRVRKKSSKLTDFESPDEIDIRFKRKTERPPKSPQKILKQEVSDLFDDSDGYIDDDLLEIKDEPLDVDDWGEDDDDEMDVDDNDGGDIGSESLHVDEDSTDVPRETSNFNQSQSLYLSEKQAKKSIMLKDGQVVQRKKAQRKDKGKSRFTAYMLWAREVRPGIIQANPQMDFSAVNKRLGELWALVPTSQKYNWKRRAKRLAAKGNQKGSMISTGKAAKQPGSIARSNLINKGGVKPQAIRSSKPSETNQNVAGSTPKMPVSTPKTSRNTASSSTDPSPPITYKVTGRTPIDVAAHIKLLGESLNNIGQKLKEHEGQIAVSGSLSVLLDSMLCVLGPLTCLTAQVEQMRGAVPETTLMTILDNIAYIMPGIV